MSTMTPKITLRKIMTACTHVTGTSAALDARDARCCTRDATRTQQRPECQVVDDTTNVEA